MNEVIDDPDRNRFELREDGAIAIAAYERDGDMTVFVHTEVPSALEGHGVGSRLIAGALAQVRAAGGRVRATCPFVVAYLQRHPEWRDLMA